MPAKEIKQVAEIHAFLTEAAEDDDGDGWEVLQVKLLRKNKKPLMFVCNDLGIQPERFPWRLYKADWVAALLAWVSYC